VLLHAEIYNTLLIPELNFKIAAAGTWDLGACRRVTDGRHVPPSEPRTLRCTTSARNQQMLSTESSNSGGTQPRRTATSARDDVHGAPSLGQSALARFRRMKQMPDMRPWNRACVITRRASCRTRTPWRRSSLQRPASVEACTAENTGASPSIGMGTARSPLEIAWHAPWTAKLDRPWPMHAFANALCALETHGTGLSASTFLPPFLASGLSAPPFLPP